MFTEFKEGENQEFTEFVPVWEKIRNAKPKKLEPSLKNLSYLLKHKELWPKDFSWYYPDTKNCAIGLSREYWGWKISDQILPDECSKIYRNIFIFGKDTRKFLFFSWKLRGRFQTRSPLQVAREIDLYLAGNSA